MGRSMSKEKKVIIEVIEPFKYAYRGCDVVDYAKGDVVEVSEEVAELAKAEKWARLTKKGAPENKDAGNAPENKGE